MKELIDFIRKYGHLNNPQKQPSFTGKSRDGFVHPLAQRYTHYRNDPFMYIPAVSGDEAYLSDFLSATPQMLNVNFEKKPLEDIPDSDEYALVDIGSELGRRVTRPFARAKPHVKVVMVDYLDAEQVSVEQHYQPYPRNDLAGEELKVKVHFQDNIEDTINELMEANGYCNVRYLHKKLTPASHKLTLPELNNRRLVVTGWKNPGGLGSLTASVGIELQADKLYFNNSALERMLPDSPNYSLLREFLSSDLESFEIDKIIDLIYDPEAKLTGENDKYNFNHQGQRCFGLALKLLFVMAQRKLLVDNGFDVELFDNKYAYGHGFFNNPHYNVFANQQSFK